MTTLRFAVPGEADLVLDTDRTALVIAGWTGRDPVARDSHIAELEALGVKRPATTPIFYRAAAARLTTAPRIEVTGGASSGEAEFALIRIGGRLYVGAASDHTDREVETYGVTVSKQMCDKPMAPLAWKLDDVRPHWDRLVLRAFAVIGQERVLYQEGSVALMLEPDQLLAGYVGSGGDMVMLGGTFAAIGGIRPADRFEFELEDPVLGRSIRHGYDIETLPVVG